MSIAKLLITFLLFTGLAVAQTGRPVRPVADGTALGNISGRVVLPNGVHVSEAIKLTLRTTRDEAQTVIYTDNQGQFEFKGVAPGIYTLEVEADRERFEPSIERVQVFRGMPSILTVALKEKGTAGQPKDSKKIVSVSELDEKIPPNARREFDRASKAAKEEKNQEAIDHLRRAIAIYPNYAMAHNDLGAHLLEMGKLDEAAASLRLAINIDAKAFNPQLNLGMVLIRQRKFSEAAETLDKALSLEPDSPAARLYDGLALMGLGDLARAQKELKSAYDLGGAHYALALFHLGQIYMHKGEREAALKAFEDYLRDDPHAANAAQVQKLIGMLR